MKKPEPKSPHVLILTGEVTEEMAGSLMGDLLRIEDEDPKDEVTIRICSHGGCARSGMAIYDAMRATKNWVNTECWGTCGSIAALMLQGGDTRLMSPSSCIFLHDVQVGDTETTIGSRGLEYDINRVKEIEQAYWKVLSDRINLARDNNHLTPAIIKKWCQDNYLFSADGAVMVNLADDVIKFPSKKRLVKR